MEAGRPRRAGPFRLRSGQARETPVLHRQDLFRSRADEFEEVRAQPQDRLLSSLLD